MCESYEVCKMAQISYKAKISSQSLKGFFEEEPVSEE
jgi:hypothetical protein